MGWHLQPCALFNNQSDSLKDHHTNDCKPETGCVVPSLIMAMIYDEISDPICGCKSRTALVVFNLCWLIISDTLCS